jgi:glucose-1-phosphate adenylyltransferase
VTIAVLPVSAGQAANFGIVGLDDSGRVSGFVEKPQTEEQLVPLYISEDWIRQRGIESKGRQYLASMGIYLFNRDVLIKLLNTPPLATDFGKEIFPRSIRTHHVHAHLFDGYWEDLGTVKSYHEANLALAGDHPPFDFHSPDGVIYTRMRFLPASRINGAHLERALVSDGCVIQPGTRIERCVVGVRSRIGRNVSARNSVLLGSDRFETEAERIENQKRGIPNFGVGDGSVIEQAILDKDCRIGRNVQIVNRRNLKTDEGPNYVIRDGIVVIPKASIVPDGTII